MAYRILLAEDNEMEQSALKDIFTSEGYQVDSVSNGLFALDKVKDNEYHLIVTDLVMPVSDGIQFLYSLSSLDREIPVIVLTGYDNIENMLSAYQMGAIDVLYKPYDVDKLLDLCRKILENRI
ncbi:response regulator receiver protein [Denitrovibrio acetiphilus DSM 12809]|jgi:DNA-binding NtrC family response regulator|uniref:Response regulator receiver protein n=1 Tax=Denitrovibrio acetiphilus (strain DSM 12809 / NBRC 114555 / N2460) TaxID=522772 RepID=D4H3M1_DENA2|nr:response regulator [Denitrovibrio acetiphilus]ADD69123.1 response regulator receiver protein [Denitrovibrio acetiphilus DSM 12809]